MLHSHNTRRCQYEGLRAQHVQKDSPKVIIALLQYIPIIPDILTLINCFRFGNELPGVRLKDIERLALSLSVFNYTTEHPIVEKILTQLRNPERSQEMER